MKYAMLELQEFQRFQIADLSTIRRLTRRIFMPLFSLKHVMKFRIMFDQYKKE